MSKISEIEEPLEDIVRHENIGKNLLKKIGIGLFATYLFGVLHFGTIDAVKTNHRFSKMNYAATELAIDSIPRENYEVDKIYAKYNSFIPNDATEDQKEKFKKMIKGDIFNLGGYLPGDPYTFHDFIPKDECIISAFKQVFYSEFYNGYDDTGYDIYNDGKLQTPGEGYKGALVEMKSAIDYIKTKIKDINPEILNKYGSMWELGKSELNHDSAYDMVLYSSLTSTLRGYNHDELAGAGIKPHVGMPDAEKPDIDMDVQFRDFRKELMKLDRTVVNELDKEQQKRNAELVKQEMRKDFVQSAISKWQQLLFCRKEDDEDIIEAPEKIKKRHIPEDMHGGFKDIDEYIFYFDPNRDVEISVIKLIDDKGIIKDEFKYALEDLVDSTRKENIDKYNAKWSNRLFGKKAFGGLYGEHKKKFDYLQQPNPHKTYDGSFVVKVKIGNQERLVGAVLAKTITWENIDSFLKAHDGSYRYPNHKDIKERIGNGKYLLIDDMIVAPDYQGMKIGSMTEKFLKSYAQDNFYDGTLGEIELNNLASLGAAANSAEGVGKKIEVIGETINLPRKDGGIFRMRGYLTDFDDYQQAA